MELKQSPNHPALPDRPPTFFRLLMAALLGAAWALAVMQRSDDTASPKTGPARPSIIHYAGSPGPDRPPGNSLPDGPAVQDRQVARVTLLGAEPAQYMLLTFLSLVGFLAWRISQARLGGAMQNRERRDADAYHGGRFSSDALVKTH